MSTKAKYIESDIVVSRHAAVGGNLNVQGGGRVGGDLKVEGWLEAKNIKTVNKGLFASRERLEEVYPRPLDGWFAGVAATAAQISALGLTAETGKALFAMSVGVGGTWVHDTGKLYSIEVDEERVSRLAEEVTALTASIGVAEGIAPLDVSGQVPRENIPHDYDDVKVIDGFVHNITRESDGTNYVSSPLGSNAVDARVVYDTFNCRLMLEVDGATKKYYYDWADGADYGNYGGGGRIPRKDTLYVVKSENCIYYYEEGNMVLAGSSLQTGMTAGTAYPGDAGAQNNADIATLQNTVTTQGQTISSHGADISALDDSVGTNTANITELQSTVASQGKVIDNHTSSISSMSSSFSQLAGDLLAVRNSVGQTNGIAPLDGSKLIPRENIPHDYDDVKVIDGFVHNVVREHVGGSNVSSPMTSGTDGTRVVYDTYNCRIFLEVTSTHPLYYYDWADGADYGVYGGGGRIPRTDTLYINKEKNQAYYWDGLNMKAIGVELGTTAETAYPGDAGAQNSADIAELQSTAASHRNLLSSLSADAASASNDIGNNTADIAALQRTVTTQGETIADHTSDIGTLQGRVGNMSDDIEGIGGEVTVNTSNITTLQETVSTHGKTIAGHTNNISTLFTGLNATGQTADEAAGAIEILARDFAQYTESEPLTLTVAQSDKAIGADGLAADKAGYAISQLVSLRKGYIYLYRTADGEAIDSGVALCAKRVTKPVPVIINYSYIFDEQERVATATADYDPSLVYDYDYDEDGVCTITDADGNAVQSLPAYRTAEVGSYVPMFLSLSADTPTSGYYAVLCNDDCEAVFSVPLPVQPVKVASYGILRSLANQKEDKAVVAQISEKVAELAVEVPRNTHDIDAIIAAHYDGALPTLCGQPPILFGAGAPVAANVPYNWHQFDPTGNPNGSVEDGTAATGYNWNGSPSALGQQYYDVSGTTAVHYIAVRSSFDPATAAYYTLIWKQC